MGSEIRMVYGLEGEKYYGSISISGAEPTSFEGKDFSEMMLLLRDVLITFDEDNPVDIILSRVEREGSEYKLDRGTKQLLRTDPDQVVLSMTHPARTIVIKEGPPVRPMGPLLRVGHDTLADAFGDRVYVRCTDETTAECPCCGRLKLRFHAGIDAAACANCLVVLDMAPALPKWLTVSVDELLGVEKVTKFFLPRSWNSSGSWISREALQAKYEQFNKERENAQ